MIPVFVINLKRSPDRRKNTIEQLNRLGIKHEVVEAIDGNESGHYEFQDNNKFGIYKTPLHSRFLLSGEKGCALSHLMIYEKIVNESIPVACIVEDDNFFSDGFADLISNEKLYRQNWNLLYLGHHSGDSNRSIKIRNKIKINTSDYYVGEALEPPFGSYGYIITNTGAKILLKNCFPLNTPFDSFLGKSASFGLKVRILNPPCVMHNYSLPSTIYSDPDFRYPTTTRKKTGEAIKKLYARLPLLVGIRNVSHRLLNTILITLRRTGAIKNRYSFQ